MSQSVVCTARNWTFMTQHNILCCW